MFKEQDFRRTGSARAAGFAGSALIALGGLTAGAVPVWWTPTRSGLVCVYSGLALLLLAWWWHPRSAPVADLRRTAALWAAPLLVAPPLFSRDVYSYLAQGRMLDAGLDVYRQGPAALGGLVADQVPAIWQHTPSPYGPVFLMVAEALAGPHLMLGVIALRLVAVAGLALLAVAVRELAGPSGVSPSAATWLAVLNPLVLIHLVGGAHNDALMVGLLAAGLALTVRRRPLAGAVLVAAAALVKAPAVVGLGAVVAIWATRPGVGWPRAVAGVGGTAALTTVLLTAVSGTGYGWVGALGTPISPGSFSLTGLLGRVTGAAEPWRYAGPAAVLAVAVLVWHRRDRLGPVQGVGLVLLALVAFGPAIRPWYALWGLIPLAAAATDRRLRRALAGCCAGLALVVLPDGYPADAARVLLAATGVLIGLLVFLPLFSAPQPAVREAR